MRMFQRYDEQSMLKAIVHSAVVWMKNGLNIKRFRLVIFKGNDAILETFKDLKREHNRCKFPAFMYQLPKNSIPMS